MHLTLEEMHCISFEFSEIGKGGTPLKQSRATPTERNNFVAFFIFFFSLPKLQMNRV